MNCITERNAMIRNSESSDRLAIKALTEAIGFEVTEVAQVLLSFDACHKSSNPSSAVWFMDDDDGVQGAAYVEPERMTDGTYNLLLIAVYPEEQKKGRGTRLMRHAEDQIVRNGGRVLIVETMGTDDFDHVRRFYERLGYVQEAKIRDFYGEGLDKIVYWKKLAQTSQDLSMEGSAESRATANV